MMQMDDESWWNMMQMDDESWWNMMQMDDERWWNMMQMDDESWWNMMQMDDERWWKLVEVQSSTEKQKKDIPANSPMQTHPSRLGSGNRNMASKAKPPAAVPKIWNRDIAKA